jgi:hypothetical protein
MSLFVRADGARRHRHRGRKWLDEVEERSRTQSGGSTERKAATVSQETKRSANLSDQIAFVHLGTYNYCKEVSGMLSRERCLGRDQHGMD